MQNIIYGNMKSKLWSGTIFCTAFNNIPIAEAFITSYHGSRSHFDVTKSPWHIDYMI